MSHPTLHPALLALIPLLLTGAKRVPPVTFAEAAAPTTLHPLYAASTLDLRAQAPIYDPLVEKVGGSWTSVLATAPPTVDGGAVTLHLRKDVKFHDGEKLGADDVCATVDALRSRDVRTPLGVQVGPLLQHCGALPSDPSTVVIRLADTGTVDPLAALGFPVLPAHLGPLTDREHPLATAPVGTGPWRARESHGALLYEPFRTPHHEGDRPVLRRFVTEGHHRIHPPDADTPDPRLAKLTDENLQGWPVLPADLVEPIRGLEGWTLHPYPLQEILVLTLDHSEPPFSDPALRQAVHRALDRQALCDTLLGTWPDAKPAPCRPTVSPFPLDHSGTNHGIRLPEPTPHTTDSPKATLTLAIAAELPVDVSLLGLALSDGLPPHENLSVEVVHLADLLAMEPTERRAKYDAVVSSRFPATADLRPELALTGGRNWFGLANPELTEALSGGSRDELHTLHATLSDTHVLLPLVELTAMSAWSSDISPLWMTPTDGLGAVERWGFSEK